MPSKKRSFSVASFYEDEIWLERAFEEVVLVAIKTCAPDKAPRLDGYTMALSKSMGLHQAGYYGNHEPLPSKRSNGFNILVVLEPLYQCPTYCMQMTLIFCGADKLQLEYLSLILLIFESISGLHINMLSGE
ncbi:hypothetical protein MTR67_049857 [Solanum verrucosum]|uniref:Uncharacterized protein n=1 Tax=Solanum verrucosum TaxID=315347 RepID=A0AAF0V1Q1_SOLVR|nr:hypothetical protein MTR67_049857 [Solanum verrucosum]